MAADEHTTVLERSGRRLAYAEYGAPGGAPVVLCHGTPGSRLLGAVLDDAATDASVRLLVPDRPGVGCSTHRPGRRIGDWPATVEFLADELSLEEIGVVGFSGGGPYALACAAARPDLVSDVGLLASAAPPDAPCTDVQLSIRVLETLARTVPTLTRGLLRLQAWIAARRPPSATAQLYTDRPAGTDDVDPAVAEVIKADLLASVSRSSRGVVRDLQLLASPWEIDLASISAPVTAHYGGRDENAPVSHGEYLADRLPNAELEVHADADHLAVLTGVGPSVLETVAP